MACCYLSVTLPRVWQCVNTQIDVPVITGLVFLLSLCGREYICVRCGCGNAVVINCVVMQFRNEYSRLSNFGRSGEATVTFYRVHICTSYKCLYQLIQ
jgi:hypothetical protein